MENTALLLGIAKRQFMNMIKRLLGVVMILLTAHNVIAANWLFKNGQSDYKIVVTSEASVSEQTAAKELQDYLYQISGARLPITTDVNNLSNSIFVGYSSKVAELTGKPKPADDDEGFYYQSVGGNLLIWGGSQRGTMYGVFTFLEKELGVHWLAPDCTIVPQRKRWKLPLLSHHESPAIPYRYNFYYVTQNKPAWSAHNKENMRGPATNEYGNQEGYWSHHTMGRLVPVHEFYQSNPEYFSLREGKRLSENEQLCLSNPDVLELCTQRLRKVMHDNPGYRIYSLSQNDNLNFCQCKQCAAIEDKYGGHSGLIVWFVNQVADTIHEEFPDKYVSTFAYHYSRKPPVNIVPRENVVIRLCSSGCCYAHPLVSGCQQNEEFENDLRGWAEIAPHLFIWDYIVDFAQYVAPWPNFHVLAPNIRAFRDNNAIGVFEEAQYQSIGSEFEEMKSWTVNQLLWNPDQDTDSLVSIFIDGYYGKAAPKIMKYYKLCQSLVKPDLHFGIKIREDHAIYSEEFLRRSFKLLDDARRLADSKEVRERVERVRMQPLFLQCMRHRDKSLQDGTWDELIRLMRKYNTRPREKQTLDDFVSHK